MLAHTETLRNFVDGIAPIRYLTLKLFAEIRFAHGALLASNLGKKMSTNLAAIQKALTNPGLFIPAITNNVEATSGLKRRRVTTGKSRRSQSRIGPSAVTGAALWTTIVHPLTLPQGADF